MNPTVTVNIPVYDRHRRKARERDFRPEQHSQAKDGKP